MSFYATNFARPLPEDPPPYTPRPDEAEDNGLGFAAGVISAFLLLALTFVAAGLLGLMVRGYYLLLLWGWSAL